MIATSRILFVVAAWTACGLGASPARADEGYYGRGHRGVALDLGADLDGAAIVAPPHPVSGATLTGGSGLTLRVGAQIHRPFLRFVPEVSYGYQHFFATNDAGTSFDWNTHRFMVGARVGFGEIIVPVVYAHVGYGWRDTADPTVPPVGGTAFDAGFALDFHLIPHLGFGPHAEYAAIDSQPYTPQWLALGLHADLAL
jgi:hypothetical protein